MAWFDQTSDFSAPQDFGEQQSKITRQRELAKAMLAQGMGTPLQGQMVSGHYVKPHFLQYLNQIGNTLVGTFNQDKADKDQADLIAKALDAFMSSTNPTVARQAPVVQEEPQVADPASSTSLVDALVKVKSPEVSKLMEPDNSLKIGIAGPTGAPGQSTSQAPVIADTESSPYIAELKSALQRRATGEVPTPAVPVSQPDQAVPAPSPAADHQKQIYTLLSLAQVQGPIGDMARLQIQNMAKHQSEYAMHTDNNGNAFLFDKHTGQYKKIDEAGGRKFKEFLQTQEGVFKTYTNGDTELMPGVQSLEQAKILAQEKERESKMTEKKTEFDVKSSEDKAKIQSELASANSTIKTLVELRALLADGAIKTGALAGPMTEANRYNPFGDNTKVDRAKMLIKQLEAGSISSLKGLGSMSNIDFQALQKRLPNFSLDKNANLELIDSMINNLDTASRIGGERLSQYDRSNASAPTNGVPAYGQRFNGPSAAPVQTPVQQKQSSSSGGATFKW